MNGLHQISYSFTNLNMMTDSPGSLDYDNDVLGNRTWREKDTAYAWKYVWDSVNRMTQAIGYNGGATYKYRADGMRVKKVGGYSMSWNPPVGETGGFYTEVQVDSNPTYRYFYDGQMCFEDDYLDDEPTYYGTRYGLGARGVDFLQTFGSGGSESGRMFPVYDGHGNMICTVARNGTSGYYAPKDVKEFGPWGDVRNSANASALPPNKGYCANLGHQLDDESGLIYMRARYYEPGTGRFISEDSGRQGFNWYAYCTSNPTNVVDESGHWAHILLGAILGGITAAISAALAKMSGAQYAFAIVVGVVAGALSAMTGAWIAGVLKGGAGVVVGGARAGARSETF